MRYTRLEQAEPSDLVLGLEPQQQHIVRNPRFSFTDSSVARTEAMVLNIIDKNGVTTPQIVDQIPTGEPLCLFPRKTEVGVIK